VRARENPFRTERLRALPFRRRAHLQRDGPAAPRLRDELSTAGGRAAIVGPHGSGKTTLLHELGQQLEADGFRLTRGFLNDALRTPPLRHWLGLASSLGAEDAVLFDGFERLSRLHRRALGLAASRAGRLIATSHYETPYPTLIRTSTDSELLRELTAELIGPASARIGGLLDELREQHRGNLRDVFLALYDLVAREDPRVAELGPYG